MEDRHYENKCYVLLSIGMVGKLKISLNNLIFISIKLPIIKKAELA